MAMTQPAAEHAPDTRPEEAASAMAPADPGPVSAAGPGEGPRSISKSAKDEPPVEWRPPDFAAVQECLTLLARAIRQFHTYPATSPLCIDAVATCQKALLGLGARDPLVFRVSPRALVVDGVHAGAGTAIEHELAHRLHRAQVAVVEIARSASVRDLTRFCIDLSAFGDAVRSPVTFEEVLIEHGVSTIVVQIAHRPEVLDVGSPGAPVQALVDHEKQRRQTLFASGGPVLHLYPPDKGWVRVDPATDYDSFSLVDLAVLIDNPAEVAVALMRLTGDDPTATADPAAAFEQKFTDLATIFSAVDPRLSRMLFSKLSRAVLELDTDRRSKLLKRTVLPGLLDGKLDGSVLSDFPDVDLAEALCLLLDLETAAPDVLTTALDRLGLSPERRSALVPLLEERINRSASKMADSYGHDHAIERYARKLIEVTNGEGKSFAEYTAFDLAVTDHTRDTVTRMVAAIAATDYMAAQLETVFRLVRLEPNPTVVGAFMARTLTFFETLERNQQWALLAQWAGRYRELAERQRGTRPDAADAILAGLEAFCTVPRALAVAELFKADGKSRALTYSFVDGFGATATAAFVAALDDPHAQANARPLVSLMGEYAETFAPALVDRLATCGAGGRAAFVKVAGAAGAAYMPQLIALLQHDDEQTVREALRALARVGTAPAAAAVAGQLETGPASARAAAEEALWHFPPAQATAQARRLLASREFVMKHPDVASHLLDRAAQAGATGLAPVLQTLTPLRFRFWNPALVRVAMKARQLLHP